MREKQSRRRDWNINNKKIEEDMEKATGDVSLAQAVVDVEETIAPLPSNLERVFGVDVDRKTKSLAELGVAGKALKELATDPRVTIGIIEEAGNSARQNSPRNFGAYAAATVRKLATNLPAILKDSAPPPATNEGARRAALLGQIEAIGGRTKK